LAEVLFSKLELERYFIFPPHLASACAASALPGEMQKHKIVSFHWNATLLHSQTSTSCWLNLFSLVTGSWCSRCCM